jgi:hypothetical protein
VSVFARMTGAKIIVFQQNVATISIYIGRYFTMRFAHSVIRFADDVNIFTCLFMEMIYNN